MVAKKPEQTAQTDDLPASKSQRKRDAHEFKTLASTLIGLSASRLRSVPLDEDIREAIMEARGIRAHVARKRQLQYVAKLMRRVEVDDIRSALEAFDADSRQLTARQHRCEAWRDRLLEQGDEALAVLLQQRPGLDVQALRQLVRNARREMDANKPPAATRALFRLLRDIDQQQALPSPQAT